MHIAVIGAGAMGADIVAELARREPTLALTVIDTDEARAKRVAGNSGLPKAHARTCDARDLASMTDALEGASVTVNAAQYDTNVDVMRAALDAWMIQPDWIKGQTTPENCSLGMWIDHMDHICQLAGNARHIAIGTDLDGGYGKEQCPHDLDTIADLQKVPDLLRERGYSEEDIAGVMHGNWVRLLSEAWG